MKRIFHSYLVWEDYVAGMWRVASKPERDELLPKAIAFTGDANLYGSFMLKVLDHYPLACEHNLSDRSQNRRAWIGHAAACFAIHCPEDVTRAAWGHLTAKQQYEADKKADEAIHTWEARYAFKNTKVPKKMGRSRVP